MPRAETEEELKLRRATLERHLINKVILGTATKAYLRETLQRFDAAHSPPAILREEIEMVLKEESDEDELARLYLEMW